MVPAAAARARAVVVKRVSAKASQAAAACVPPYVLDDQGRKRFKPECF
jgi:hypothetical protein